MKGYRIKFSVKILSITAALCLAAQASGFVCHADENDEQIESMKQNEAATQETISNLEKQTAQTREAINLLQGQREQSESAVTDLKSRSSSYQSTINEYSDQLDDLESEISETEKEMNDVSSEIVRLNGELSEIQRQKDERYALLKNRMKTVYERGGTKGMITHILESVSFKQMLTRTEYMNAIIVYDQNKIAECKALEEQLKQKIAEVEKKEAELDEYQGSLDKKYDELEDLTDEVMGMLASTNLSLSTEKEKLENYDRQLAELDKKMKSLESQTAAAQAELARQVAERLAKTREDTSGSYSANASELEWLAATIQAEAGGESYTGKLAVGSVIMNRVKSSAFPNDIKSVITQNMQFASYRSGKVELIIAKGPNSTCVQAAEEVLGGARVGDYLFFMTKYYADYYGIAEYNMIGNHAFFYRWVVKQKQAPSEQPEQPEQPKQPEQPEQPMQPEEDDPYSGGDEESPDDDPYDDDPYDE